MGIVMVKLSCWTARTDTMEICVDSVESALNAIRGGACRLELCSCLELGGLTPSLGLLRRVRQLATTSSKNSVPVYVLVRPNAADDFVYSPDEVLVMIEDIRVAKEDGGADGIVIGALNTEGSVDVETMTKLMSAANPLPVTFHRAIDVCRDPLEALDVLSTLGCHRVLTSGQKLTAWDGRHCIKQMLDKVVKDGSGIIVMPGSGITTDNLNDIIDATGAKEFHASCKVAKVQPLARRHSSVTMGSRSADYAAKYVCDADNVAALNRVLATRPH